MADRTKKSKELTMLLRQYETKKARLNRYSRDGAAAVFVLGRRLAHDAKVNATAKKSDRVARNANPTLVPYEEEQTFPPPSTTAANTLFQDVPTLGPPDGLFGSSSVTETGQSLQGLKPFRRTLTPAAAGTLSGISSATGTGRYSRRIDPVSFPLAVSTGRAFEDTSTNAIASEQPPSLSGGSGATLPCPCDSVMADVEDSIDEQQRATRGDSMNTVPRDLGEALPNCQSTLTVPLSSQPRQEEDEIMLSVEQAEGGNDDQASGLHGTGGAGISGSPAPHMESQVEELEEAPIRVSDVEDDLSDPSSEVQRELLEPERERSPTADTVAASERCQR